MTTAPVTDSTGTDSTLDLPAELAWVVDLDGPYRHLPGHGNQPGAVVAASGAQLVVYLRQGGHFALATQFTLEITETPRPLPDLYGDADAWAAVTEAWTDPTFVREVTRYVLAEELVSLGNQEFYARNAVTAAEQDLADARADHTRSVHRLARQQLLLAALDPQLTADQSDTAIRLIDNGFPGTPEDLHATVAAVLTD